MHGAIAERFLESHQLDMRGAAVRCGLQLPARHCHAAAERLGQRKLTLTKLGVAAGQYQLQAVGTTGSLTRAEIISLKVKP